MYMTFNHFAEPELHKSEKVLNGQVVRLPRVAKHLVNSHMVPSEHTPHPGTVGPRLAIPDAASLLEFFLAFGQEVSLLSPPLVQTLPFWMFIHAHIY